MATVGITRNMHRCARVSLNGTPIASHGVPPLPSHRIAFRVQRTNKMEPNPVEVQIYGLAREKRNALTAAFEKAREAVFALGDTNIGSIRDLVLEAGYDGVMGQLIAADIISLDHENMRPGWVTTIVGQDSIVPWMGSLVNESFAGGVSIDLFKTVLASSLKVAFLDADSEKAWTEALTGFAASKVEGGLVLQGPMHRVLTEVLEDMKLAWSFQDGKLVLQRFDTVKTDVAVELSPKTGLTAPLTIRRLGRAQAKARAHPLLLPGRQVKISGVPQGAGIYRIDSCEQTGDTESGPWDSVLELRPSVPV